jgi:hypothetical protein
MTTITDELDELLRNPSLGPPPRTAYNVDPRQEWRDALLVRLVEQQHQMLEAQRAQGRDLAELKAEAVGYFHMDLPTGAVPMMTTSRTTYEQ